MNRIERISLTIWRIQSFISFLIAIAIGIGAWALFHYHVIHYWHPLLKISWYGYLIVISLYWLLKNAVLLPLRYRHARYEFDKSTILLVNGGWSVEEVVIPTINVQHVNIQQGVLARKKHVCAIVLYTAGSLHRFEYISKENAEEIKRIVMNVVKKKEVMQDEDEKPLD